MTRRILTIAAMAGSMLAGAAAAADSPALRYDQAELAIANVRLVDGTGAPARSDINILIRNGRIAAVGPARSVKIPAGVTTFDGRGKTVLPGLVFTHEHMFYPSGGGQYGDMLQSFPPLYLAGGVTTARTGGTVAPYGDINLRDEIAAGRVIGPDLDVTGPYIEGKGLPLLKVHKLQGAAAAERFVDYWADAGATSFKAYNFVTRNELKRAIDTAHKRGLKLTGHLCSITFREAADLGIDNLEHGIGVATDFVKDKKPDICPQGGDALLNSIDPESREVKDLIAHLVARKVAITSTLVVFEDMVPGRPKIGARARSVMLPQSLAQYDAIQDALAKQPNPEQARANFEKQLKLDRMFALAGGTLLAGTDPTGIGGALPGFASKRQLQLFVEAGFSFEEAVKISSLNGAIYLGRDKDVGSVETGKRADLILVDGDPVADPAAIEHMRIVFKGGRGYDSEALIDQAKGLVGLR